MKTNETSISECMICGSHQLTSLGSRCKYPTANGCCDGEMQLLYKSTRANALAWWKSINGTFKQRELGENYCKTRPISVIDVPLTGREIEEIWRKENPIAALPDEMINTDFDGIEEEHSLPSINESLTKLGIDYNQTAKATNSKVFKQFDEPLFRAYISKFSDEDKLKAINCLGGFTVDQTVRAYSCGYGDRDANLPQFHGEQPVDYLNKLKH